jgi:hypothetical protein
VIYEFLKRFVPAAATRYRRHTLASLHFPSHEELAQVGLTGQQFFDDYIRPLDGHRFKSPQQHAHAVLSRFWRDYPQLRPPEVPA